MADRDKLAKDFSEAARDVCRVSIDHVEFVAGGTLAADAKMIVDERTWK